jgi:poly(3-hydroxybutyrate) depolymerase
MVARISAEVRIDPDRIYATGISNGGMLAYRLACDTMIFAAVGPGGRRGCCTSTSRPPRWTRRR